jgi:hypothetical protein
MTSVTTTRLFSLNPIKKPPNGGFYEMSNKPYSNYLQLAGKYFPGIKTVTLPRMGAA